MLAAAAAIVKQDNVYLTAGTLKLLLNVARQVVTEALITVVTAVRAEVTHQGVRHLLYAVTAHEGRRHRPQRAGAGQGHLSPTRTLLVTRQEVMGHVTSGARDVETRSKEWVCLRVKNQ